MKKENHCTQRYHAYFQKWAAVLVGLALILTAGCSRQTAQQDQYMPPDHVTLVQFSGSGTERAVLLAWDAPDTQAAVVQYVVYGIQEGRVLAEFAEPLDDAQIQALEGAEEVARTENREHAEIIGNQDYCFFVTAVYDPDTESSPSNLVCTGGAYLDPVDSGAARDFDREEVNGDENDDNKVSDMQDIDQDNRGLCFNPYYPAVVDASYAYQVTGTRDWVQIHTITEMSEEGFKEEVVQDLVTHIYQWECLPEGLVNTYGGVMTTENDTVHTASDTEGITIPSSISLGDTWTQTSELTSSDGMGEGELKRSVTLHRSAAAIETVTVPAGTFEAIRVDYDLEMHAAMETSDGHTLPFAIDSSAGSEWYVKDIGLIKKTAGVDLERMDTPEGPSVPIQLEFHGVFELIEFSLPW